MSADDWYIVKCCLSDVHSAYASEILAAVLQAQQSRLPHILSYNLNCVDVDIFVRRSIVLIFDALDPYGFVWLPLPDFVRLLRLYQQLSSVDKVLELYPQMSFVVLQSPRCKAYALLLAVLEDPLRASQLQDYLHALTQKDNTDPLISQSLVLVDQLGVALNTGEQSNVAAITAEIRRVTDLMASECKSVLGELSDL
jgi:hypothetical protein